MARKDDTKRDTAENSGRTADGRFAKDNSHAFKPGESGNPGGRPKSRHFAEAARKWLAADCEREPFAHMTNAEALVEFLGQQGFGGDSAEAKVVLAYAEGQPRQTVDVAIEDRKREAFENAVAGLMEADHISRDEAIEQLLMIVPEAKQWVN